MACRKPTFGIRRREDCTYGCALFEITAMDANFTI
jgi:hypothetical protein